MSGIVGNIGQFDGTIEQWSSYSERFEYFVLVNYMVEDNIVLKVFSVMGPKTSNLLVSLLHPDRTGNKAYGDIVEILKGHVSPEPLVNTERFRLSSSVT